jgi:uncharacterized protein (DUF2336 family)
LKTPIVQTAAGISRMAVTASLIPELEEVIQEGSPERRAQMLGRITTLFLQGASRLNDEHVQLFDDVLGRLIVEIEAKARAELSRRLAPVSNAPTQIVRTLATDDDIAVAGPMLTQSARLDLSDLVEIASTKSQAHLLAISGRHDISEPVTEVLVKRGDRNVVRGIAANRSAQISESTFSALVGKAEQDGELAEKIGARPDVPPQMLRALMLKATAEVQQRMFAAVPSDMQLEIRRVLAKVTNEVHSEVAPRDFSAAQLTVKTLRAGGDLNEAKVVDLARAGRYEETVAALALLCAVPIEVVDRLMSGDRPDPVLILAKSAGWSWATARAIIMARSGGPSTSSHGLDAAFTNFERLSPATAQRVMRFWQARPASSAATN